MIIICMTIITASSGDNIIDMFLSFIYKDIVPIEGISKSMPHGVLASIQLEI